GTLTQNRMTLVKAYVDGMTEPTDVTADCIPAVKRLLQYGTLCCDGSVSFENGKEQHIGDPTETAIVLAAHRNGMPKDVVNHASPRLTEIPFDSDRKLMTTVHRMDGRNVVIVKGAFDMLAPKCIAGDLQSAKKATEDMSSQALRVLAIAYKQIDTVPEEPTTNALENGLTFMGLVGMIDPPRPEAREAVKICRNAGIKPVMITGDHVVTASAIAKDLGILLKGDDAITGAELAAMSEDELNARVRGISVYARVSPEDKIRIVRAWQRQGQIVSMTGDGVNDAPALKAADIGCAMGITGTDVAKGAADMTLTDDNFATIVDAVREGRGIYDNIRKVVGFLLGTNIGEVLTVFFAMLLFRQAPLLSMQLLWINLVTDSLPAIALGMEEVERDIMNRKPKPKTEGIFANGLGVRIGLQGVLFAALTLFAFWHGQHALGTLAAGQTMAFLVLSLSQVVHAFNMRSNHSLFQIGPFTNRKLNSAALISVVLIALVTFIPPIQMAFGLVALPGLFYLEALGLSFVSVVFLEFSKRFGLIHHQG
ncbi:MAG: cation-translocating P-type ATPase, partial [Clostridia bacterium]